MNIKELVKAKTAWLGLSTVIGGIFLIKSGNLNEGLLAVVNGLGMIFVRDAILKIDR